MCVLYDSSVLPFINLNKLKSDISRRYFKIFSPEKKKADILCQSSTYVGDSLH